MNVNFSTNVFNHLAAEALAAKIGLTEVQTELYRSKPESLAHDARWVYGQVPAGDLIPLDMEGQPLRAGEEEPPPCFQRFLVIGTDQRVRGSLREWEEAGNALP